MLRKFLNETNDQLADIWTREDKTVAEHLGIVEAASPNAWKMAEKAANQGHWLDRLIGICKAFGFKDELAVLIAVKKYADNLGSKPDGIESFTDGIGERMVWKIEAMEPSEDQWRSVVWGLPYDALRDSDLVKYRSKGDSGSRSNMG